ncbi:MAG: methyl-accepting chemotaxis protein [Candidatus Gastranaerophilales bacterium]|nr:methyl-accepting chemotaxis protein [Candidatus Gastranaerophilales bacterium]
MLKDYRKTTVNRLINTQQAFDTLIIFAGISIAFLTGMRSEELGSLTIVILVLGLLLLLYWSFYATKTKLFKKALERIIFDSIEQTYDRAKEMEGLSLEQKENLKESFSKLKYANELVNSLKENLAVMDKIVDETQNKTNRSLEKTNEENLAVKANIEKMFTIRHKIQTIAELILELSEFIQSISSTIGTVEDIAEQTNLLALNAAVEAARAGEHGKGFAVVAGEIRKLADESKQATAKISSLITDIEQTTNSTVIATEEGTKEIESGIDLAHSIGSNVEELIEAINEISVRFHDINSVAQKINKGASQTESFVQDLNDTLEITNKTLDETEKKLENINQINKGFKNTLVGE